MFLGLVHRTYEESLRELSLFSPERKILKLKEDFAVYSYLIGGYRKDGSRVFLEMHSKRMRDNRHKVLVSGGGSSGLEENLIFRKGKEDPGNYKVVIITLIPAKVMRQLILDTILRHMKDMKVLGSSLHRFMKGKSGLTHLTAFCNEMTDLVDRCRVFDTVSHNVLIDKLMKYRLDKLTVRWIEKIVSSKLFNIPINNLDDETECILSKFNNWLESRLAEKDLRILVDNKLGPQGACVAKMTDSLLDCIRKIISSRLREVIFPLTQHRERTRDNRQKLKYRKFYLNIRKKNHCESGQILEQISQRGCTVSLLGDFQNQTGHDPEQLALIHPALSRGLDLMTSIGTFFCLFRSPARNLGWFSLEKRRLQEDLIAVFQYLKGSYKKGGERLFTKACSDRTRGRGFKLKEGRFRLDIRKKFFMMTVMRHWNRLPRDVVAVPSLEMFKVRLDGALSNLI
ncbi:hypothetical protein QYF61_000865 [Mycteria americana]|uniref:Reverse transcriptase domain-containing protein n=1 Tax=Mycteria americana TaxID=33587 RepID=A0AAN7NJV3_MYCAM|nr:hypothetical protein QYF61_000865 [Mycteria americana]